MSDFWRGAVYILAGVAFSFLLTRFAAVRNGKVRLPGEIVLFLAFALTLLLDGSGGAGDRLTGLLISSGAIAALGYLLKPGRVNHLYASVVVILMALIAFRYGIRIDNVYSSAAGAGISLGWYALPITVLWLLLSSRLYESTDKLPGLSLRLTAISALTFAAAACIQRQETFYTVAMSLSLAGCSLGILLGWGGKDQVLSPKGSLLPGYLLGSIAIIGALKYTASLVFLLPVMVMGIPLINSAYPFAFTIKRETSSISIGAPSAYLYRLMIDLGISERAVIRLRTIATAYLCVLALVVVANVTWLLWVKILFLVCGISIGYLLFVLVLLLAPRRVVKRMTGMDTIEIMDVKVSHVNMDEALHQVEDFIKTKRPHVVITPNAPAIMQARDDEQLKDIINRADLVTPDGAGVLLASRLLQHPLQDRVAGIDLLNAICAMAAGKGYSVYMLGSKPGVALDAADKLRARYPGLTVAGVRDGYYDKDEEDVVIDDIVKASPDILFVAFGIPRQEKWIDRYKNVLGVPVCMGVGGSFDVISGRLKRAPVWMQRCGLEWVYRVAREPKRIGRILSIPHFLLLALLAKHAGVSVQEKDRKI
ncbi:MAG: WecB/TagA/CpsF family glycosyltransferase [bacterium]|nr:WecB/TagA/CpsF family glycosyltransferase [bacterium]